MYMLPIAGQTAGPNELTFFVDSHVWSKAKKNSKKMFFKIFIFFPRATPGPSAST